MSWSVLGVKELNTLQSKFRYHLCLENWQDIFRSNCLSSSTNSTIKFFYFPERCDIPLGSEDGRLPDVSFTASSIYNAHYAAYQGRLNAMRSGSRYGSWIARYNNRRQWFQVDLGNRAIIIKIGIQGRYDANQWVKSFTVSYGMNGFHFRFYKEGGRTRVCETTIGKFSLVRGILLMNARAII